MICSNYNYVYINPYYHTQITLIQNFTLFPIRKRNFLMCFQYCPYRSMDKKLHFVDSNNKKPDSIQFKTCSLYGNRQSGILTKYGSHKLCVID